MATDIKGLGKGAVGIPKGFGGSDGLSGLKGFNALSHGQAMLEKQKADNKITKEDVWDVAKYTPANPAMAREFRKLAVDTTAGLIGKGIQTFDPVTEEERGIKAREVREIDPTQGLALQHGQQEINNELIRSGLKTKAEKELSNRYDIDPDKVADLAQRATDEMGLPADTPEGARAMFYVQKNKDNEELLKEYEMSYFERVGEDLFNRAKNTGAAYDRFRHEMDKAVNIPPNMEETDANLFKDREARKRLRSLGAMAGFGESVIGEVGLGALEIADNLVSGGVASREIYNALESDEAKQFFEDLVNSGAGQSVMKFIQENPETASDIGAALNIVGLMTEFVGGGMTKRLGTAITESAVTQAGKRTLGKIGGAGMDVVRRGTDALPEGVKRVGRGVGSVAGGIGRSIRDLSDQAIQQIGGIAKETRRAVVDPIAYPFYKKLAKGVETTDTMFDGMIRAIKDKESVIGDLGSVYDPIRNARHALDVSGVKTSVDDVFDKMRIGISDKGVLDFIDSALQDAKSQAIVQKAYDIIKKRGKIDSDVALNIRGGLSDMINYKVEVSPKGESIVKQIRHEWDKIMKEEIPGLKELDDKYAEARKELSAIKSDYFNSDGTIKDTAKSRFINVAKDRNSERLKRIEKLYPEAEGISKAILAYEDVERAMAQKTATYVQGSMASLGITSLVGGVGLGSTMLLGGVPIALAMYTLSNPRQMVGLLQKVAKFRGKLSIVDQEAAVFADDMIDKIADGTFNKKDVEVLQKVVKDNKDVQDLIDNRSLVPVSEGPLQKGATLPEGAQRLERELGGRPDITEIDKRPPAPERPKTPEELATEELLGNKEAAELKGLNKTLKQQKEISELNPTDAELDDIQQGVAKQIRKGEGVKEIDDFTKRIQSIEAQEQRIRKVGSQDVKNQDVINKREMDFLKKKEGLIEEIQQEFNVTQDEAVDMYLDMSNKPIDQPKKTMNESIRQPSVTVKAPDTYKYIKQYTTNGADVINTQLRGGDDVSKDFIKKLESELSYLPSYKGETYRLAPLSSSDFDNIKVGDIILDKGFTSTSKNKHSISNFEDSIPEDKIGVTYKIKSSEGKDISSLSAFPGENEVLFKQNTKFKVEKIDKRNQTITLKDIPTIKNNPKKTVKAPDEGVNK